MCGSSDMQRGCLGGLPQVPGCSRVSEMVPQDGTGVGDLHGNHNLANTGCSDPQEEHVYWFDYTHKGTKPFIYLQICTLLYLPDMHSKWLINKYKYRNLQTEGAIPQQQPRIETEPLTPSILIRHGDW